MSNPGMATRRSSRADTTVNGASPRTSAGWYGAPRAPSPGGDRVDADETRSRPAPPGRQPAAEEPHDADAHDCGRQPLQGRPDQQLPRYLRALQPTRNQEHNEISEPGAGKEQTTLHEYMLGEEHRFRPRREESHERVRQRPGAKACRRERIA